MQKWEKIKLQEFWIHKIVKISFYPCRLVRVKISAKNYLGNLSYVALKLFLPVGCKENAKYKDVPIFCGRISKFSLI